MGDLRAVRAAIAALALDVLVYPEVGMCALTYALSAARLAPVTLGTWCFAGTAGQAQAHEHTRAADLAGIDFYVSSTMLEPEGRAAECGGRSGGVCAWRGLPPGAARGAEPRYSEQLVRMEGPAWWYPSQAPPPPTAADEALLRARIWRDILHMPQHGAAAAGAAAGAATMAAPPVVRLYLCLQAAQKLHPAFDAAILAVLQRDAAARVVLLRDGKMSQIVARRLARLGDDAPWQRELLRRVVWVRRLGAVEYWGLLRMGSVMLDSFPYGGFTTAMDALGVGLPVVTMRGADIRGRWGAGALERIAQDGAGAATSEADEAAWAGIGRIVERGDVEGFATAAVEVVRSSTAQRRAWLRQRAGVLLFEQSSALAEWARFLARAVRMDTAGLAYA